MNAHENFPYCLARGDWPMLERCRKLKDHAGICRFSGREDPLGTKYPSLSMIVATDPSRVIGKNKDLPWPRIKEDMKWFKKKTSGHVIIMGRKTYESLGKPLPRRANFVITRNRNFKAPGCFVYNDADVALKEAFDIDKEPIVIGGSAIYELFLPRTDTLYLTEVKKSYEGDTFFPELDLVTWDRKILDETEHVKFTILRRRYDPNIHTK